MKRRLVLLGAIPVVLTIGAAFYIQSLDEVETDRAIQTPVEVAARDVVETSDESFLIPDPVPQAGRLDIQESNADSCAEALRLGIAHGEQAEMDEATCALVLRMITGPRVPALPGFSGFEVRDAGDSSPRARLFAEPDDPAWSRTMEGRILSAAAEIIDFPAITLHSVCRSSTCGFLIAYTVAAYHGGSYNYYAEQLADELGFSGYHAGSSRDHDGIGLTFIYLGDWSTPRLE